MLDDDTNKIINNFVSNKNNRIKCDYCNIENNESKLIVLGNWNNLYIKRNDDGDFYITAKGDGIAEMKINFCPKCGKNLIEE